MKTCCALFLSLALLFILTIRLRSIVAIIRYIYIYIYILSSFWVRFVDCLQIINMWHSQVRVYLIEIKYLFILSTKNMNKGKVISTRLDVSSCLWFKLSFKSKLQPWCHSFGPHKHYERNEQTCMPSDTLIRGHPQATRILRLPVRMPSWFFGGVQNKCCDPILYQNYFSLLP